MDLKDHIESARKEIKQKLGEEQGRGVKGAEELNQEFSDVDFDVDDIKQATDFQEEKNEEIEQLEERLKEKDNPEGRTQPEETADGNPSSQIRRGDPTKVSESRDPEGPGSGEMPRSDAEKVEKTGSGELESKIERLEQKVEQIEHSQPQNEINLVENRLDKLSEELQEVKQVAQAEQFNELENRVSKLEEDDGYAQENQQAITSVKKSIDENKEEIESLSNDFMKIRKRLDERVEQINTLSQKVDDLEKEQLSEGPDRDEFRKIKEEIDKLKANLDQETLELSRQINQNQDEIQDLTKNLVELSEMVKDAFGRS